MKTEYATVDDYLASLPHELRYTLTILRKTIKDSIDNVKETMDYGMPTYRYDKRICSFVVQNNYYNLYIFNEELLEKYKDKINNLTVSQNCIKFKSIEELPIKIIEKILKESINALK